MPLLLIDNKTANLYVKFEAKRLKLWLEHKFTAINIQPDRKDS